MRKVTAWQTESPEQLINCIKSRLDSIKASFFDIGGYLYEARERRFYNGLYPDIISFSRDLFGFEKTMTYDLINVFVRFRDGDSYLPKSSITHLNQSQLVALASCKAGYDALAFIITPSDSVQSVRKAVKIFNKMPIKSTMTFLEDNLTDFILNHSEECSVDIPQAKKDFSVQTENNQKTLYDLYSEFTDSELLQSYFDDAVCALREAADLCVLGGSFRNDVIDLMHRSESLFERFLHASV